MKILVSAQDPGGANSVVPVAEALALRGEKVVAQVNGAARDIFSARGIPLGVCSDPDVILLGTSGGESIEKQVMVQMHGKVPTIAVVDFWSNYWQRFSSPGVKDFAYLSDVVCVMDDVAKEEMISEGFPNEQILVTGNPHFDHFADNITCDHEDPKRILFISQPMRLDGMVPGFELPKLDEYAILETIREAMPSTCKLSIRLHPRDIADKYDEYLGDCVSIASESTLEEAITMSGLIIGVATPVLMQAAAAGKKVLSYEPFLEGRDDMVSNRVGVTTLIQSPQELSKALKAYATGKWPYQVKPMRDVWPSGATERVVEAVLTLAKKRYRS